MASVPLLIFFVNYYLQFLKCTKNRQEIPHDLMIQCFYLNFNQYLLEKSLHGPLKSQSWMHSGTFLSTYEFDHPKCVYPEILRYWARAYLRPLPD